MCRDACLGDDSSENVSLVPDLYRWFCEWKELEDSLVECLINVLALSDSPVGKNPNKRKFSGDVSDSFRKRRKLNRGGFVSDASEQVVEGIFHRFRPGLLRTVHVRKLLELLWSRIELPPEELPLQELGILCRVLTDEHSAAAFLGNHIKFRLNRLQVVDKFTEMDSLFDFVWLLHRQGSGSEDLPMGDVMKLLQDLLVRLEDMEKSDGLSQRLVLLRRLLCTLMPSTLDVFWTRQSDDDDLRLRILSGMSLPEFSVDDRNRIVLFAFNILETSHANLSWDRCHQAIGILVRVLPLLTSSDELKAGMWHCVRRLAASQFINKEPVLIFREFLRGCGTLIADRMSFRAEVDFVHFDALLGCPGTSFPALRDLFDPIFQKEGNQALGRTLLQKSFDKLIRSPLLCSTLIHLADDPELVSVQEAVLRQWNPAIIDRCDRLLFFRRFVDRLRQLDADARTPELRFSRFLLKLLCNSSTCLVESASSIAASRSGSLVRENSPSEFVRELLRKGLLLAPLAALWIVEFRYDLTDLWIALRPYDEVVLQTLLEDKFWVISYLVSAAVACSVSRFNRSDFARACEIIPASKIDEFRVDVWLRLLSTRIESREEAILHLRGWLSQNVRSKDHCVVSHVSLIVGHLRGIGLPCVSEASFLLRCLSPVEILECLESIVSLLEFCSVDSSQELVGCWQILVDKIPSTGEDGPHFRCVCALASLYHSTGFSIYRDLLHRLGPPSDLVRFVGSPDCSVAGVLIPVSPIGFSDFIQRIQISSRYFSDPNTSECLVRSLLQNLFELLVREWKLRIIASRSVTGKDDLGDLVHELVKLAIRNEENEIAWLSVRCLSLLGGISSRMIGAPAAEESAWTVNTNFDVCKKRLMASYGADAGSSARTESMDSLTRKVYEALNRSRSSRRRRRLTTLCELGVREDGSAISRALLALGLHDLPGKVGGILRLHVFQVAKEVLTTDHSESDPTPRLIALFSMIDELLPQAVLPPASCSMSRKLHFELVSSLFGSLDYLLLSKAAFRLGYLDRALRYFEEYYLRCTDDCELDLYRRILCQMEDPDIVASFAAVSGSLPTSFQMGMYHEGLGDYTQAEMRYVETRSRDPANFPALEGIFRSQRHRGSDDFLSSLVLGTLSRSPIDLDDSTRFRIGAEFGTQAAWRLGNWDAVDSFLEGADPRQFLPEQHLAQCLSRFHRGGFSEIEERCGIALRLLTPSLLSHAAHSYRRCLRELSNLQVFGEILQFLHFLPHSDSFSEFQSFLEEREDMDASPEVQETCLCLRRSLLKELMNKKLLSEEKTRDSIARTWLSEARLFRKANNPWRAEKAIVLANQLSSSLAGLVMLENAKLQQCCKARPSEVRSRLDLVGTQFPALHGRACLRQLSLDASSRLVPPDELELRYTNFLSNFDQSAVERSEAFAILEKAYFRLGGFLDVRVSFQLQNQDKRSGDDTPVPPRVSELGWSGINAYLRCLTFGSRYVHVAMFRWFALLFDVVVVTPRELLRMKELSSQIPTAHFLVVHRFLTCRLRHANPTVRGYCENCCKMLLKSDGCFKVFAWQFFHLCLGGEAMKSAKRPSKELRKFQDLLAQETRELDKHANKIIERSSMPERHALCANYVSLFRKLHAFAKTAKVAMNRRRPGKLLRILEPAHLTTRQRSLRCANRVAKNVEGLIVPTIDCLLNRTGILDSALVVSLHCDDFQPLPSKMRPTKMSFLVQDGRKIDFILKIEDLGSKDGHFMDLFHYVNMLLRKEATCCALQIRLYSVVHLRNDCILVEFVQNTATGKSIVGDGVQLARKLLKDKNLKSIHSVLDGLSGSLDLQNLAACRARFESAKSQFHPGSIAFWYLYNFATPALWLESRQRFTRSLAVMSIVGYLIGLGDRHLENALIDKENGEFIHIDLDISFDFGLFLPVPEIVPIRLTRSLVRVMGVAGVEGTFRRVCERVLNLLHEKKGMILPLMSPLVHAPILDFAKLHTKMSDQSHLDQTDLLSALAERHLMDRLRRKLELFFDEMDFQYYPWKSGAKEKRFRESPLPLSVAGVVDRLIHVSTDEDNLARMYPHWSSFV